MKIRKTVAFLPPEVLSEILKWLPARNLLKLRFVCKLWNSVISDQRFHQQHYLHQLRTKDVENCNFMILKDYQVEMSSRATSVVNIHNINVAEFCRGTKFIKGYVDGLVLLHVASPRVNRSENAIFLWNPMLGKVIDIPVSESLMKFMDSNIGFGFGFDIASNNYKLVALNLKCYDKKTKVYNLGSGSWTSPKEKGGSIENVKYLSKTSHTFNFEGTIYWLARVGRKADNVTHYLRFNLSTEAFTCSKLPDFKYDGKLKQESRHLSTIHGSLALIDCSVHTHSRHLRVWVRRKDTTTSTESWIELYNLDHRKTLLKLTSNGEVYLRSRSPYQTIYVYDLKSGEEKVASRTIGWVPNSNNNSNNIESLALLGQPHSRLLRPSASQKFSYDLRRL